MQSVSLIFFLSTIFLWHSFNPKCQYKIIFVLIFSAPGGDFQALLDKDQVPFEQDVQRFLRQVAEGLQFMHELNIAHLDIKVTKYSCYVSLFESVYNNIYISTFLFEFIL